MTSLGCRCSQERSQHPLRIFADATEKKTAHAAQNWDALGILLGIHERGTIVHFKVSCGSFA